MAIDYFVIGFVCFILGIGGTAAVFKIINLFAEIRRELDQIKNDLDNLSNRQTNNTDAAFLDIIANTGTYDLDVVEGLLATAIRKLNRQRDSLARISDISGQARHSPFSYDKDSRKDS